MPQASAGREPEEMDCARTAPVSASTLDDLLSGREFAGAEGFFYLIDRAVTGSLAIPGDRSERLHQNLQLMNGVGPRTAERLRRDGLTSLEQLLAHERWSGQAAEVLAAIAGRDYPRLRRRGARDAEMISFFAPEDLVFIDIETTGLYSVLPLFLVGMLYPEGGGLRLRQFLARRFNEERAVLAAVAAEMPRFKLLVTYNGRSFDLPYLQGRYLAHRLPCRLDHAQFDLLHHIRRKYRGQLPDCRLSTVEAAILRDERKHDVAGAMIPDLYHEFVATQDPMLIAGIVEHNARDLLALARLIGLVLEERV